jgi:hypothetical protein
MILVNGPLARSQVPSPAGPSECESSAEAAQPTKLCEAVNLPAHSYRPFRVFLSVCFVNAFTRSCAACA